MTTLVHSAVRIDANGEVADAWVRFDGDTIDACGTGRTSAPDADVVVDAEGRRLVPGFIDLHGHGGGGHAVEDGGEELAAALATHRAHGTTRSVVSLVANPIPELERQLGEVADLAARDPLVLGAHLEGPFLSPERHGAHEVAYLRAPAPDDVDRLLEAGRGTVRVVTVAPELAGGLAAIERIAASGAVPAIGHTEADAELARRAVDAGARILTHAFNAMPGLGHRNPGPVGAAVADERVTIELILDLLHVAPEVARILLRAAPGRVALITDAMAAAGADDGDYRLGSLEVSVHDGLAVLAGTDLIAGSTLTQDAALRNAITVVGVDPVDAVAALTLVPARALGIQARFGTLDPGKAADLVLLDPDGSVHAVWAAGAPQAR